MKWRYLSAIILLVVLLGAGVQILGVRAQGPVPDKPLQVPTPVPVPPQLEPVPTPTPTVDPERKEELDRQSAVAAEPLASPPSNDDFNDALLITSLPYQHSVDTSGATVASDDPDMGCGAGVNSNTVWYRLEASFSGLVDADTFGSNYDTVLAVFTGTRGSLSWVACNDDAEGTLRSQLIFEVEAGRTYYVEVADYASPGGGLLNLAVDVDPSGAVKARVLEPGDNLIHGFEYYNGFLWASTRTSPARILKIDPDTLDYERIVLSSGLNYGEDLIVASGYIWVILYTAPGRIVRIDPETLQWQVVITFGSTELSYGGSLEYAFGYLWAGGRDRKIAKIDLNDLTYEVYDYATITSSSQFHALSSGGGYIWASATHQRYATTIVRINPQNPTDYSTVYVDRIMSDDIAYSDGHLYTGGEFTAGDLMAPSYVYRFAENLTYDSTYASDHGSYGTFAHNGEIWSAHVGSPGRIVEFSTSLEMQSARDLPIGFNNANEMAFDPDGNIYVTAWESPAKIVVFPAMPTEECGPLPNGLDTCDLQPGDILMVNASLGLYLGEKLLFGYGYWGHTAIYYGEGEIVESYPYRLLATEPGVTRTLITQSGFGDSSDWAILRVTTEAPTKENAIAYANQQFIDDRPYSYELWNKWRTDKFYCTSLVWRAYLEANGSLDLDSGFSRSILGPIVDVGMVTPDDIFFSPHKRVVALRPGVARALKRAVLFLLSPGDFYVTDPQGRHVGVDPVTGEIVNEIPGAFYSGPDTEPESIALPDMDETWSVEIIGRDTGSYTFIIEAIGTTSARTETYTGTIDPGEIVEYQITYPAFEVYMPLVIRNYSGP